MDLEAQLDSLLKRLEETDPASVPTDLRHQPPEPEAPVPEPAEPTPAEPVAEASQAQPEPPAAGEDAVVPEQAAAEDAQPPPATAADPVSAQDAQPVSTQEAQPDAGQKTGQVNEAVKGNDPESIASMASGLLDQQIDATINAATAPSDQGDGGAEPQASAEPAEPQKAQAEPKPSVSLSEDDLAGQIQGLLDEVQKKDKDTIPPREPVAAEPAAGAEAPPAAPPEAEPVEAVADAATEAPSETGAVSIDQIDEMLADSAAQAIQTEAPPVSRVPGTDEVLAAQDEAEAKAQQDAQAQEPTEPQPATPVPAQPQPVGEAAQAKPEPVQSQGASAADVAKELNEDAQAQPAEPAPVPVGDPKPQAQPVGVVQATPAEVVIKTGNLKKAEHALRRVCGTINRPLKRLSPEMRDAVGYVGVLTTAVAMFVIAFGMLF